MTKADSNLMVIQNFILHITHVSDSKEADFNKPMTFTPEQLYKMADEYIEEDHVDGKDFNFSIKATVPTALNWWSKLTSKETETKKEGKIIWQAKVKTIEWLKKVKSKLGEKALLEELNNDKNLFFGLSIGGNENTKTWSNINHGVEVNPDRHRAQVEHHMRRQHPGDAVEIFLQPGEHPVGKSGVRIRERSFQNDRPSAHDRRGVRGAAVAEGELLHRLLRAARAGRQGRRLREQRVVGGGGVLLAGELVHDPAGEAAAQRGRQHLHADDLHIGRHAVGGEAVGGTGDAAGQLAGRLRQALRLWVLWPRQAPLP